MTRSYHLPNSMAALRAAIAINNIGCSLLERAYYSQSHQTLKDSAQAIVLLLGEGEGGAENPCKNEAILELVASKLVDADLRQAFPCESGGPVPPPLPEQLSGPVPIRMTTFDVAPSDGDLVPSDLVVMSAIAVHNSALSCFYLSIDESITMENRWCLHSKAKTLMKMSYLLLAEGFEFTLPALKNGLHVLENLDAVLRSPPPQPEGVGPNLSGLPGLHPYSSDMDVEAEAIEAEALDAELRRLRELVRAVEGADLLFFGRPDGAAAA